MNGLTNIIRASVDSMMRFWRVLISGIPTLKALREGYGGIQDPGRLVLRLSEETVVGAGVRGSLSRNFLGKDTVGYCGLWRSERFNHSGTPALGRFGESYGRGQRLEKPSLELCGGYNIILSPGLPVTVHLGGLDGCSLYVLSHTHLRDPHPRLGFIQQAL